MFSRQQLQWKPQGLSNVGSARFAEVAASLSSLVTAIEAMTATENGRTTGLNETLMLYGRARDFLWTLKTAVRAAQSLNVLDTAAQQADSDVKHLSDRLSNAVAPIVRRLTDNNLAIPPSLAPESKTWIKHLGAPNNPASERARSTARLIWSLRATHSHLTSTLRINAMKSDGSGTSLTFPQVIATLKTSGDPVLINNVFRSFNSWLAPHAQLFTDLLNVILEYRLQRAENAGEPLLGFAAHEDRCAQDTLTALFEALDERKPILQDAVRLKYQMTSTSGGTQTSRPVALLLTVAADQATDRFSSLEKSLQVISDAYGSVTPGFVDFIRTATERGWIEARNTSGRAGGAWCDNLPSEQAVYLFIKNSPGMAACSQFAHLLGVGYLHHVLHTVAPAYRQIPLTLIELAGMLCETAVERRTLLSAESVAESQVLKIQALRRLVNMTLLLPMRHRLTERLLQERNQGILTVSGINRLCREEWAARFGDSVDGYDQYIWAYKNHFYRTDVTFYDWQYTFGYLLSQLIWKLRHANMLAPDTVQALISDMAYLDCESLILKHIGVDIRQKETWLKAIDAALEISGLTAN